MTAPERYGRRKVSKMLAEWNALRDAVRGGDPAQIQASFDDCEEWIDFAFAPRTDLIPSDPRVTALVDAASRLISVERDSACEMRAVDDVEAAIADLKGASHD